MDSYTLNMAGTRLADAPIGQSPVDPIRLVRGAYWRVLNPLGYRPLDLDLGEDRYWFGDARREAFAHNISGEVWAVIDPLGWYAILPTLHFHESADGRVSAYGPATSGAQIAVVRDPAADRWSGTLLDGVWSGTVSEPPPAEVLYTDRAGAIEGDKVSRVGLRRGRAASAKRGRKR